MENLIKFVALGGAILGSTLIALNITISGWAFIPYLVSNIASIYLLRKSDASKVVEYQCWFFMLTNIVGIIRWLI